MKILQQNPAYGITSPKLDKKLPLFLDVEQAIRAMELPGGEDFFSRRNHAVLEVLYGTGIRVSELVGLDISSVDMLGGVVKVKGKGRKQRLLPCPSEARRWRVSDSTCPGARGCCISLPDRIRPFF